MRMKRCSLIEISTYLRGRPTRKCAKKTREIINNLAKSSKSVENDQVSFLVI